MQRNIDLQVLSTCSEPKHAKITCLTA